MLDWKECERPEVVFLIERLCALDPELGQATLRVLERRWVCRPLLAEGGATERAGLPPAPGRAA